MRVDLQSNLSDKERIFIEIIRGLKTAQVLCRATPMNGWLRGSAVFARRDGEGEYVHFAPWSKPEPGDLVMGETGGLGDWTIAWYVEAPKREFGAHVVREIGTGRLCNYGNESFIPIRGLSPLQLLEGEHYRFYLQVLRAFARGGQDCYRFGGIRFDGGRAFVAIRQKFGGIDPASPSEPFEVEVPFGKRISVKRILAAMREGGYGTRQFERRQS